jgi:hypothetical protein
MIAAKRHSSLFLKSDSDVTSHKIRKQKDTLTMVCRTMKSAALLCALLLPTFGTAFLPKTTTRHAGWAPLASSSSSSADKRPPFEIMVDMPPSTETLKAQMKLEPLLSVPSELIEVRYAIPFGLDVAPSKGFAVCQKDGPGGEKVGDILRFTSQWTMGLPRGDGLITTAASFAGGLSWQCSLFDVSKAKAWELVVEALVSNVPDRTDEVVLLFERSLEGTPPELQ